MAGRQSHASHANHASDTGVVKFDDRELPEGGSGTEGVAPRDVTVYVLRGAKVAAAFYRRDDALGGTPAGSLEARLAPLHGLFASEGVDTILVITYRGQGRQGLRGFDARVAQLRDPDAPGPPPGEAAQVAGEMIETMAQPDARGARRPILAAWVSRGGLAVVERAEVAYAHAAMLEIAAARALE